MLLDRLSIQSKLVVTLLSVSIGSILVISVLGYVDGRRLITKEVEDRLRGMREIRSNEVEALLDGIQNEAETLASGEGTIHAAIAFRDAFHALDGRRASPEDQTKLAALKARRATPEEAARPTPPDAGKLTADDQKTLVTYYRDGFLKELARRIDAEPVLEMYLPRTDAARYLQYHYIAAPAAAALAKGTYTESEAVKLRDSLDSDAKDMTAYGQVHRRHHPRFRDVVRKFKYQDLFLIDPKTLDVVYSEAKTTAFATNLRTGPYAETGLADLVASVRKARDRGDYRLADFEFFRPDLGNPDAFLACPIFDGPTLVGILALVFPSGELNRVMSGGGEYEDEGLGKTGEVYLVGPDAMLRSRARSLLTDPKELYASLRRLGVPSEAMRRIEAMHTLVLNLPVRTGAVKHALDGESGVAQGVNYKNIPVLSAYAPFDFEGLRWAIVAEMELDEAYAAGRSFGRKVIAYSAAIIVVVTLVATLLASLIVRPIRRLIAGANRVGDGEVDVSVDVKGHDEFRELADAFNAMTAKLKAKSETIEQKVHENEQLLLNILPGPIAARRKDSDDKVSEAFADISVLFAEIDGFTALSDSVDAGKSVALLNELIGSIDEAAERFGAEKVKTFGSSYMAACGLSLQRPDHANRMVEFAMEILRVVRRFNQEHSAALSSVVGVNAGPVVGGIVGRSKFIYDLWGDTVNAALAIRTRATPNSIAVTQAVRDRLRDSYDFTPLGEVEVRGKGPIAAWAVKVDK